MGVIPNMAPSCIKKWENCICSFVLSPFFEKNINFSEGKGAGVADPSGMALTLVWLFGLRYFLALR